MAALTFILSLVGAAQQATTSNPQLTAADQDAARLAFRDTIDKTADKDPSLPDFKLSAQYPTANPGKCAECPWLKLSVNFDARFPSVGMPSQDPNGSARSQNTPDNRKWHDGHWDQYVQMIRLRETKPGSQSRR